MAGIRPAARPWRHFSDTSPVLGPFVAQPYTVTAAPRQPAGTGSAQIDADLASEAHFWRIVRNVVTHGNGTISSRTATEVQRLRAAGEITFTEFALWGPLLDAGHGGVPVPFTPAAQILPYASGSTARRTQIHAGSQIEIGLGDVLACGRTRAEGAFRRNVALPSYSLPQTRPAIGAREGRRTRASQLKLRPFAGLGPTGSRHRQGAVPSCRKG